MLSVDKDDEADMRGREGWLSQEMHGPSERASV